MILCEFQRTFKGCKMTKHNQNITDTQLIDEKQNQAFPHHKLPYQAPTLHLDLLGEMTSHAKPHQFSQEFTLSTTHNGVHGAILYGVSGVS
jgi:hypothetical protein